MVSYKKTVYDFAVNFTAPHYGHDFQATIELYDPFMILMSSYYEP